ncbi:dihydrofolate reductase family protein [Roseicyclus persicicus]|uniref:Dihydrofolate reductase n=1 Tax=Roseicyclus persicicus TaxID=2650661 RepID=A0A7X6JXL0_9RHOB|nr:dihydrofolate reductase family protein [Roseibacterium persicicum]NKX43514.1 dihydrofolate reductase [Roseibacterium persicicum]
MTEGHVFIATSLDGFIARPDHALDWLTGRDFGGEDHGYDAFLADMDGVVMGSGTFRAVAGFDPWPYALPVVVLSRSMAEADLPPALRPHVRVLADPPAALMARLGAEGWRRAYVDGGALIRSFLGAGLIRRMTISTLPVLIGAGRPLFGGTGPDIALRHEATRSFPSGLVQSTWTVPAP